MVVVDKYAPKLRAGHAVGMTLTETLSGFDVLLTNLSLAAADIGALAALDGVTVHRDASALQRVDFALAFVDANTLAFGTTKVLTAFLEDDAKPAPRPENLPAVIDSTPTLPRACSVWRSARF